MKWLVRRGGRVGFRLVPGYLLLAAGLIGSLNPSGLQGAEKATVPLSGRAEQGTVPFPRVAMLWSPVRGDRSPQRMAAHDLVVQGFDQVGLQLEGEPKGMASRFVPKSVEAAKERLALLRRLNPRIILLAEVLFYEYSDTWLPEDHPWWLRQKGERQQFWPGTHRMDWYNQDYREHIVQLVEAVEAVGFDGVFFDNLRDEPEPWVDLLKSVRARTREGFLIMANAGYEVGTYDFAAPYLNGMMYESGWSHGRTRWDECAGGMQHTESLLRLPTISLIERFEEIRDRGGWPDDPQRGQRPAVDRTAFRWTLCYALTIGDFYYLFSDNTSHRHDWYPEYDRKIGLPVGPGERINEFVRRRRFDRALVVVNLPGAASAYQIDLGAPGEDLLTGVQGQHFSVVPGDGVILYLP